MPPKSRSTRRSRKGRRTPQTPATAPVQPARVLAQPVAVAQPGEAPSLETKSKERPARGTRQDYSYVMRDFKRMAILAAAVLVTIVVLSFFLP
jgi:hypothetical protein